MLTVPAQDGFPVRASDDGEGRCLLVVHPGMDDGRSWRPVITRLAQRFRVVAIQRRQYRADRGADRCSIGREAADVVVLARALSGPVLLVGHSSGGLVALEAMLLDPEPFAGAVVYEAPLELTPAEFRPALRRAQQAMARGRRGLALGVFLRDVVQVPARAARLGGAVLPRLRRWRPLIERQIDDLAAIDELGPRLDAYARVAAPVLLLSGERSPAHLRRRTEALAGALPNVETGVLAGQGHGVNGRARDAVAAAVAAHADRVLGAAPGR